jgi:hypothetical protein
VWIAPHSDLTPDPSPETPEDASHLSISETNEIHWTDDSSLSPVQSLSPTPLYTPNVDVI